MAQHFEDLNDRVDVNEVDVSTLSTWRASHEGSTDSSQHPEATTSLRGFMSAADKTSLDGLSGHAGGTDTADHPEATTSVRGFMSATDKTK
ncbi:MAG: hypothetical protein GWN39_15590, partial [Thermoplasmata archaeon]|nr:hypothetical protein [Thermoplasmata archaeon]NIS13482.1 hypothetical protein [Thermoplasmata archaeon]NIS21358.1 hypothetical protein [Thermoplasmata archaeon]NIT78898.1 hypothetical protein [Thermoplasmata archaeon]NIV80122.1 hypothetical protein [Thermoplasmata archaeon]